MNFFKKKYLSWQFYDKLFSTKKGPLLIFAFFFLTALFLFRDFGNIYFLQDEWLITGRQIYNFNTYGLLGFFTIVGAHLSPLAAIFWFIQYKFFALNVIYYAYTAVFLHVIASFISFLFLRKILKINFIAFILSFIFLIHFNTTLSIVWLAVYYTYIPCFIFTLLSLTYFINCSEKGFLSLKDGLILFSTILIAFSFFENAILAVLLIPVYWFLFWPKQSKRKTFRPLSLLLLPLAALVGIRFLTQVVGGEGVVYEQGSQLAFIIYNFLTVPIKLIVQSIFLIDSLWDAARIFVKFAFPLFADNGLMQEIVGLELIVLIILSSLLIMFTFLLAKLKDNIYLKKILFFSIFWFLASALIIGVQSRHLYHMEFRYLYQPTIGILLLAFVFFNMLNIVFKKHYKKLIKLEITLFLIFVILSAGVLRQKLPSYYLASSVKKDIVRQILEKYPTIPKKTIFYVECNQKNDCSSNNLVLPFQSGVGQMLIVLYGSKNEKAYFPFMQGFYLWDWESQGYKEINGYGFGYFRNQISPIVKLIEQGKIKPDDVIAFSYSYSKNKIYDNTNRTRQQLSKVVQLGK